MLSKQRSQKRQKLSAGQRENIALAHAEELHRCMQGIAATKRAVGCCHGGAPALLQRPHRGSPELRVA